MKRKITASILLTSVLFTGCASKVEETTEEVTTTTTTAAEETTESSEETTAATSRPTPTPRPTSTTTTAATTEASETEEQEPYRLSFTPVMPELPESMAADTNASEEDNLTAFYNDRILPLYGQTPAEADSIVFEDYPNYDEQYFDLDGAVTYSISDFDGNGDVEMVAVTLVSETYDYWSSDTETYRLHFLLCDNVDGQVSVIKDMPVISQNNVTSERGFHSEDMLQACLDDRTICFEFMRVYTVERDGKSYLLVTYENCSSYYSDGYSAGAYMYEVTADDILIYSAYVEEPGSDNTSADEISYVNGEEVSRTTYYMYPEYYGLSEDMTIGIESYIERLGLECPEFGYFDNDPRIIPDSSADIVARMSIFPVLQGDGEYPYYPVSFRFESVT